MEYNEIGREGIVVGFDFTLCQCGAESDFGCHGVRDLEIYSEFYCKKCYNKKDEK